MAKNSFIESLILGIAGLIAFTLIAALVFLIGMVFGLYSLKAGFVSEVRLIIIFPLFFILVALIKIFIGGELILWITRFFSRILNIEILADKKRKKR